MMATQASDSGLKQYLVSLDVGLTLKNRFGLPLSGAAMEKVTALEYEFARGFMDFAPCVGEPTYLEGRRVQQAVQERMRENTLPVVSVDDIYFNSPAFQHLSVTRLTDPADPGKSELGPRPGYAAIDEQLSAISRTLPSRDVAFVDIGAFSGSTLLNILEMCKQYDIKPVKTYLGIAGKQAAERIAAAGYDIDTGFQFNFGEEQGEWVELRDLMLIDGRKVSPKKLPSGAKDDDFVIIPYTSHPARWASVAEARQADYCRFAKDALGRLQCILREDGLSLDLVEILHNDKRIADAGSQLYKVVARRNDYELRAA